MWRVADVRSLGLRTDLAILACMGGRVHEAGDHLTCTTPDNPGFRMGNLLVYPGPPAEGDLLRWTEAFDAEVGAPPAIGHRTFAWDGVAGDAGDVEPFVRAGFAVERNVVLTAAATRAPSAPATARLDAIRTDAEWQALYALQATDFDDGASEPETARFLRARLAADRRMVASGHATWWGAWEGSTLLGSLGIVRVGSLARYQTVVTAPPARRRGVASTLLHHAGEEARRRWGAVRLVIETDPDGIAVGLYRRAGFSDRERRTTLCQHPWRAIPEGRGD